MSLGHVLWLWEMNPLYNEELSTVKVQKNSEENKSCVCYNLQQYNYVPNMVYFENLLSKNANIFKLSSITKSRPVL